MLYGNNPEQSFQVGQEIIHVSGMFLSSSAANTWHKSDNRTRQMEETIVITVSTG